MENCMDRCLQSNAHQSHMVDADWIVKIFNETGKQRLPVCKVIYLVYATRDAVLFFKYTTPGSFLF